MVLETRTLRIGIMTLAIAVASLFATHIRTRTPKLTGGYQGEPMAIGPFLLEPRQTLIVLNSASSDNVSIYVVPAKSWEATQNVSLANPIFSADGMRKKYSVTFHLQYRGVYYFVATAPDGTLVDSAELMFEQTGLARDLYVISIAAIIVGAAIITYNISKLLIKRKG